MVNTQAFTDDVASRLSNRVQLSTDANHSYIPAIERSFGYHGVDYGQIIKRFARVDGSQRAGRYSPSKEVVSIEKSVILGKPSLENISTAYIERQNLQMRMNIRRFTRLTNAFSRKAANHAYAVAMHYMVYNFIRPHGTLTKAAGGVKTTPAMAAGVADRVWTVEDILARMDENFLLQ